MRYLGIIVFGVLIGGCQGHSGNTSSITVPIYLNCTEPLNKFLSLIEHEGVNFSVVEFDYLSDAYPSNIGFVEFHDVSQGSVNSYAQTVKGICDNQGVVEFSNDVRGQELLFKEIQSELGDSDSVSVVVTKRSLKYFFNEKYSDWWK